MIPWIDSPFNRASSYEINDVLGEKGLDAQKKNYITTKKSG